MPLSNLEASASSSKGQGESSDTRVTAQANSPVPPIMDAELTSPPPLTDDAKPLASAKTDSEDHEQLKARMKKLLRVAYKEAIKPTETDQSASSTSPPTAVEAKSNSATTEEAAYEQLTARMKKLLLSAYQRIPETADADQNTSSIAPLTADKAKSSIAAATEEESYEQLRARMKELLVSAYKGFIEPSDTYQSTSPIVPLTVEEEKASVLAPTGQGICFLPLPLEQEVDSVPRHRGQMRSSVVHPIGKREKQFATTATNNEQQTPSGVSQSITGETRCGYLMNAEEAKKEKASTIPRREKLDNRTASMKAKEGESSTNKALLEQEKPVLVKMVDLPGKGKGLVACAPIKRGQIIFAEKPLLILEERPSKESEKEAMAKIREMSKDDQRKLLALSNNFPDYPPILGILATNATLIDVKFSTDYYVFELGSRLNHSCSSNVFCSWNGPTDDHRVYAGRDIEEGEEVVKGSINTVQWTLPRDKRRESIADYFKFHCLCKTCTMPDEEVAASNKRRLKYEELNEAIPALIQEGMLSKVVLYCRTMLNILDEEKAGDIKKPMAYRTLGLASIANGDLGRAKAFMRLCAESYMGMPEDIQAYVDEAWEIEKENAESIFGYGKKWKSSEKSMRWRGDEDFEEWLWAHAY